MRPLPLLHLEIRSGWIPGVALCDTRKSTGDPVGRMVSV